VSAVSTVEAILEGAARALGHRGVQKLSMSDICDEAGVSRGTLYRYFKSKDDVLEALSQHVLESMAVIIQEAVDERPALEDRLRVVLTAMMSFTDRLPYTMALVQTEPAFSLAFFRRSMASYRVILERFLSPVLADSAPVRSGVVTIGDLCELFERVVLSAYVIRDGDAGSVPDLLADMWGALVAHGPPQATATA
jgi:AcrR family transcriptional regulator